MGECQIMKKIAEIIQMIKRKRQDGYLTVEASIVFSVLFFSLILILFIGMVLYQEVNLQSLAVRASERGGVIYSARVSDMTTGIKTLEDFKNRDPYRNVPFLNTFNDDAYENVIGEYVNNYLKENNVLSGERGSYNVDIINRLFSKRVKVNISNSYRMPVDSISEMFGHKGPFDVDTTAVSAVVDSPDFVRNVDMVLDVAKQTGVFETVENGYNKIMDALEKVQNLLK